MFQQIPTPSPRGEIIGASEIRSPSPNGRRRSPARQMIQHQNRTNRQIHERKREVRMLIQMTNYCAGNKKRQGRPPAVWKSNPELFLVDCFLQFGTRGKFRDFAGGDLDGRAGLWVAAVARLSLRNREGAEAYQATRSPLRRAEVMLSTAVSIAVVACALLISHAPAILSTRSALFIVSPRRSRSCPAETGTA